MCLVISVIMVLKAAGLAQSRKDYFILYVFIFLINDYLKFAILTEQKDLDFYDCTEDSV